MTEPVFDMPYSLTDTEMHKGTKLTCSAHLKGRWRITLLAYVVMQRLALSLGFMFAAYLVVRSIGEVPGKDTYLMFVLFFLFGLVFLSLERGVNKRGARLYEDSLVMQDQKVQLSSSGITFANGRSTTQLDWRDVDEVFEGSAMIVPTVGYQAVVLPDRVLALAGDPAALRQQIHKWHQAARVSP